VTPLYPQKLALTSPTGGGRSVGIVRVRTKATEFSYIYIYIVVLLTGINYYIRTGIPVTCLPFLRLDDKEQQLRDKGSGIVERRL